MHLKDRFFGLPLLLPNSPKSEKKKTGFSTSAFAENSTFCSQQTFYVGDESKEIPKSLPPGLPQVSEATKSKRQKPTTLDDFKYINEIQ